MKKVTCANPRRDGGVDQGNHHERHRGRARGEGDHFLRGQHESEEGINVFTAMSTLRRQFFFWAEVMEIAVAHTLSCTIHRT